MQVQTLPLEGPMILREMNFRTPAGSFAVKLTVNLGDGIHCHLRWEHLELQTTIFKWLFQLDVSTSLLEKLLFHQTSIQNWLFRVPGISYTVCSHHSFVGPSSLGAKSFRYRLSIHHPLRVFIGTPTGRYIYIYT